MQLVEKNGKLQEILQQMGSAVVAYSGGVDSSFLLRSCIDTLGRKYVLPVISVSEIVPKREVVAAKGLAAKLGIALHEIHTRELGNISFYSNPHNRCYFCKQELFASMLAVAHKQGYAYVADGANIDDLHDYRPGSKAGQELGVRSPLQEAGLTKSDIRQLSHQMGLSTWNKPAKACIATRFPYGDTITIEKIHQVEQGEELLEDLGFSEFRLRHHGTLARIELPVSQLAEAVTPKLREHLLTKLTDLGFTYITIDLQGFASGSMNKVIAREEDS